MDSEYDVVIIGAGPAGYLAGIRLGQLGAKVAVVEKENVGGECTNYACIPIKTLIHYLSVYQKVNKLSELGLFDRPIKVNVEALNEIKNAIVKKLTVGILHLLKANKVDVVIGEAVAVDDNKVLVKNGTESRWLRGTYIIVATGSKPKVLPILPFDCQRVISSREAVRKIEALSSVAIVGGGAVGIELASLYSLLNVNVTIVEVLERIGYFLDKEISNVLERELRRAGVNIYTSTEVVDAKTFDDKVELALNQRGEFRTITVDKVIVAVGRDPNVSVQGLRNLGVEFTDSGFIKVDSTQRTTNKNVFAIGDITGPPFLAHKAYWEGLNVAEFLFGEGLINIPREIPIVLFSKPEVLSVGVGEEEAKNRYGEVLVGRFPFAALGKAVAEGATVGLIKVIALPQTEEIIGIHIVGECASEYAGIASLIVENRLTLYEVDKTMFPHPTYSEGIWEAVKAARNEPLHMVYLRKKGT